MKNDKNLYFVKRRWLYLLYFPLYLIAFFILEQRTVASYHIIHTAVDDYIPFCEYFVIPYFLWFGYIGFAFVAFIFQKNGRDYYQLCANLFLGMTVFLVVSAIYPNMQQLRPTTFADNNIFVTLTKFLYSIDSSTNIFPSIHVFNALGIHIAITKSQRYASSKYNYIKIISFILMVSITLATMFLKQHSFFDVVTAFGMQLVFYPFIYGKHTAFLDQRIAQHETADATA